MKTLRACLRVAIAAASVAGVFYPQLVLADSLTLVWDANPEPEVTGYQVHVGEESGVYTRVVDVGNTTTYVFPDAVTGQQYCFVLVAYTSTLSSPFSEEVCGTTGNALPYLSQPVNQVNSVGQGVSFQLLGGDPGGEPVVYSASGLPTGLGLDSATGMISGVATTEGGFAVTVAVTDGTSSVTRFFTWTINAANRAPVVANPGSLTHVVGQLLQVHVTASDPDGQALTFSASGLPGGLTIAPSTGMISGTPSTAGTYNVIVSVTDGSLIGSTGFTWVMRPPNEPPSLTHPGNQTSNVNQAVSLALAATDPDGDSLTFAASGLPLGLDLSTTTGLISGTPTAAGTTSVTVTASDGRLLATQSFTWTVRAVNDPPQLAPPGNQTHDAGQPVVLQLNATDANGDALTFSATGLPPGLTLSSATGRVAGIPTTPGSYSVVASVSDGSASASRTFSWTIAAVNAAPALTNPGGQTGVKGQATSLALAASDANGDPLTYAAASLPPGLSIVTSTGVISGSPAIAGVFEVTVSVSDGTTTATQVFTWTVTDTPPVNGAPTLSNPGTRRNNVGDTVSLMLNGDDGDGDPITFGATGLPPGLSVSSATGIISGVPTTPGRYTVIASVSDGARTVSQGFSWIIRAVNVAPLLTAPADRTDEVGLFTALTLVASDANGDTLTFSASGLPAGLTLNTTIGTITGAPTTAGTFAVNVSVTDGAASVTATFTWTIDPVNHAPSLSQPGNQFGSVGQPVTLALQASDSDGDALIFGATGLPPGLGIAASSGVIAGTPTTAGTYAVTVSARDTAVTAQRSFTWSVQASNVAPVLINPGPQTTTTGQTVVLQLAATDANSDSLVFAVAGLPPGLVVSNTGRITGTPNTAGTFNVTATVTDGALSAQHVFGWLIRQANVAPALSVPSAQTSRQGDMIMIQAVGSDINGDVLTFAATGLPTGLAIAPATGWISGTTTEPGSFAATVSVSDGVLTTQRSFGWTVLAAATEETTNRGADSGAPTGTTAIVRPPTETATRVYMGVTARTRTPPPPPPAAPTAAYTSTVAVARSVDDSRPTLTMTGSSARARSESADGSSIDWSALSQSFARSLTRETESSTTQVLTSTGNGPTGATSRGRPALTIETPVADARFGNGSLIHFMATARDYSGVDLSARIMWSSNVDGALGIGGSLVKTLSSGSHVISARVADRRGRITTMNVTVVIE